MMSNLLIRRTSVSGMMILPKALRMMNTTRSRSLSTFGVFDSREKTEENMYIREQEKHNLDALHDSEQSTKREDQYMHALDAGRSEILHILLETGEPLRRSTIDRIAWSLFKEFEKIPK